MCIECHPEASELITIAVRNSREYVGGALSLLLKPEPPGRLAFLLSEGKSESAESASRISLPVSVKPRLRVTRLATASGPAWPGVSDSESDRRRDSESELPLATPLALTASAVALAEVTTTSISIIMPVIMMICHSGWQCGGYEVFTIASGTAGGAVRRLALAGPASASDSEGPACG